MDKYSWSSTIFLRSSGLLRNRPTSYYSLSSPPSPSNPLVFPDIPVESDPVCLSRVADGVFLFNNDFSNSGTGSFDTPTVSGGHAFVESGSGHY